MTTDNLNVEANLFLEALDAIRPLRVVTFLEMELVIKEAAKNTPKDELCIPHIVKAIADMGAIIVKEQPDDNR